MEYPSTIAPWNLLTLISDGISKKQNGRFIIAFNIIALYEVTRGAHYNIDLYLNKLI